MSISVHQQQAANAVSTLREKTIIARDRIHAVRNRQPDQDEGDLLASLRADQIALRQGISSTHTALKEWQEYIDKLPVDASMSQFEVLKNFPTGWDEIDQPAEGADQAATTEWRVFALINRANDYANTIDAYFVTRNDVIPAASSNSSGGAGSKAASRQGSRPPTPDTHRFFANAQRVFKVSPNNVAQPGTLFGPAAYVAARQHATNAPVSIYTQPAYAPPNAPAGIYTQPAFAPPSAPTGIYTRPPAAPPISVASSQAAFGGHLQPAPPISSAFGGHFQPGMPMSSIRGEHFQPNPPRTTTMGGHFQPNPPSMAAHAGHFQPEPPKAPTFGGQMPAPPRPTFMKPVRLEPPKFSGKSREWATFWTAFDLAVDSQQLQPFEKHLLLLQYLEKDSEAHRAVAGYPPTDDNYPIVKQILYNRYGNQDALEDELYAELFHLKPVTKNVWRDLRTLHSDIERICLQIEQQSRGASNDKIVCHLIKSKLPKEVLAKLLEMEDKSGGTWTAAGLRYGIDKIITDQERIDKYVSTFHPAEPRTTQDKSDKGKTERQRSDRDQQQTPSYRRPYNIEDSRSYLAQSEQATERNTSKFQQRDWRQRPCSLCNTEGHRPSHCQQYPTPQDRQRRLIEQKRCLICLRQDHATKDCSSGMKCTNCQLQGHHRLTCFKPLENRRDAQPSNPPNQPVQPKLTGGNAQLQGEPLITPTHAKLTMTEETTTVETTTLHQQESPKDSPVHGIATTRERKHKALLMTRTVLATTRQNSAEPVQCVVFFDSGSETSYVARKLVDQLQPPQIGADRLRIHTFGNKTPKEVFSPIYAIHLQQEDGDWTEIQLNMIDEISTPMTTQQWSAKLRQGCEPFYRPNCLNTAPDILIGIRQFWTLIVKSTPIPKEPKLHIIDTLFGPVLGGELDTPGVQSNTTTLMAFSELQQETMPKAEKIEAFWSLESIGIRDDPAQDDDQLAIRLFNESVQRLENGMFQVTWVWKIPRQKFGPTWNLGYRRLLSVWKRLSQTPELLKQYNDYFCDQRAQGFLEPCGRDDEEFFVPHHPVVTPKKLRVVLDASAKTSQTPSLNDCLYPGPVLLPELVGMLFRWRSCAVPVLADVQSAFLAIQIAPDDRRFCKIMWLKDFTKPPSSGNLTYERYTRMVFGVNCSPFLLAAVLLRHFANYDSPVARELEQNTYVDNVLLETDNAEEAIQKAKKAKAIFADCRMNLREFYSHLPTIMEQFPPEDRLDKPVAKVLGLLWDTPNDSIRFEFPTTNETTHTRRSVLSLFLNPFNPLGLLNPCILPAKLLFQQLWDDTHHWDEPLTGPALTRWTAILQSWHDQIITIPRQMLLTDWSTLQMHVFCDASDNAFATAIYIRCEAMDTTQSRLIFSKSRLRPLKARSTFTTPRLELLAIVAGVRAAKFVAKELRRPIAETHFWSDSRISLAWIQSGDPKPLFEQRRVKEIRQTRGPYHFVRTDENPADVATRGATPAELRDMDRWWFGPPWLAKPPNQWPDELSFEIPEEEAENAEEEFPVEEADNHVMIAKTEPSEPEPPLIDGARFANLRALIWCILMILRFIGRLRPASAWVPTRGPFSACDYEKARKLLIKLDQKRLRQEQSPHPTMVNLDGLICIKTRIIYCNGPESMAHPILLDRFSPLTRLIIEDIHQQLKHAGTDWTLTKFLGSYWIPRARRTVKSILDKCLHCRRMKKPPFARPTMPPLPAIRVRPARCFEFCGLDTLGPTLARVNGEKVKVWTVIIVCLVTRAVYLEPTRDLSAASFINVLRRFFARRGRARRILSDNAPSFIQTAKALDILTGLKPGEPPEVHLAKQGTRWDFIPALSPWFGSTWERLVALVKNATTRTIGRRILDYDDLCSFTAETEAAINSRPITHVSDSHDGPLALTPNHFLNNGAMTDIETSMTDLDPDDPQLSSPERLAAHWQALREAADYCWSRWSNDYMLMLRERAGWNHKDPRLTTKGSPKVGDVVLIKEDLRPRSYWPLGRVVEVNGQPPNIRSAKIQMHNGNVWTRPVNRLCPLETAPILPSDTEERLEEPPIQPIAEPPIDPNPEPPFQPTPEEVEEAPQLDRETVPNKPSTSKHRMVTRHKARQEVISTLTSLAILLSTTSPANGWILWPFTCWPNGCPPPWNGTFGSTNAPSCNLCNLSCTDRGVAVSGPPEIQKIEVCCLQSCLTRPTSNHFTFDLASDAIIIDYECEANFWTDASHIANTKIHCPAIDSCELFDCWFCADHLQNPTCNKQWAAVLYSGIFGTAFFILGCALSCYRSVQSGLRVICHLFAFLLSTPLRFSFWLTGRKWTEDDEEKVAKRLQRGANTATRQVRRSVRLAQLRANRLFRFVSIVMMIAMANASSETISFVSHSESCRRGDTGLICTVNTATTLTLLPAGQVNTFLVRDEHGIALASLTFRLTSLTLDCHPKTEAWLRSYTVQSLAVKRCPRAGSCFADHCSQVRPNSAVPELKDVQKMPGNAFCLPSTSFWGNDCGLPASACLYYRNYANPTSRQPYELFSCPGWSTRIEVEMTLEVNGGQSHSTKLNLHPGLSTHWKNVTITPLAVSLPPLPVLRSKFITNGQAIALADQAPTDLHCQTEEEARTLNCTLDLNACADCFPDHTAGTVDCHCRHANFDELLETPEVRLPITIAKIHLRNSGPQLFAQHTYSPVQLHLRMQNFTLAAMLRDSKCWVTPHKLVGCYRCSTGAQFTFDCRTDNSAALAKVDCAETVFVAHCSVNGTANTIVLPFDHYEVDNTCKVECAGGETDFRLNGTLYYIPVRRQFAHQQHTAEIHTPGPESSNLFGFDLQTLLFLLAYWPWIVTGVVIGLAALFLFIQFSPIFMAYRTAARLITILSIAHCCGANTTLASADVPPSANPPSPYFLTFLLASLLFVAILWRQVRLGRPPEVVLPFLAFHLIEPTEASPILPKTMNEAITIYAKSFAFDCPSAKITIVILLLLCLGGLFHCHCRQKGQFLASPSSTALFTCRQTQGAEYSSLDKTPLGRPRKRPSLILYGNRANPLLTGGAQGTPNTKEAISAPAGRRAPAHSCPAFGSPAAGQQLISIGRRQHHWHPPPTTSPFLFYNSSIFQNWKFEVKNLEKFAMDSSNQRQIPSLGHYPVLVWRESRPSNRQGFGRQASSTPRPLRYLSPLGRQNVGRSFSPLGRQDPFDRRLFDRQVSPMGRQIPFDRPGRRPSPDRQGLANQSVSPIGRAASPEQLVPLSTFLADALGGDWPAEHRQLASELIEANKHRIQHAKGYPLEEGELTGQGANGLWVTQFITVEDFWNDKGAPLAFPGLPCWKSVRGVRGTSKKAKKKQRQGGTVWLPNTPHYDYHPLERLFIRTVAVPPIHRQPASSRQVDSSTRQMFKSALSLGGARAGPSSSKRATNTIDKPSSPPRRAPSASSSHRLLLAFIPLLFGLAVVASSPMSTITVSSTQGEIPEMSEMSGQEKVQAWLLTNMPVSNPPKPPSSPKTAPPDPARHPSNSIWNTEEIKELDAIFSSRPFDIDCFSNFKQTLDLDAMSSGNSSSSSKKLRSVIGKSSIESSGPQRESSRQQQSSSGNIFSRVSRQISPNRQSVSPIRRARPGTGSTSSNVKHIRPNANMGLYNSSYYPPRDDLPPRAGGKRRRDNSPEEAAHHQPVEHTSKPPAAMAAAPPIIANPSPMVLANPPIANQPIANLGQLGSNASLAGQLALLQLGHFGALGPQPTPLAMEPPISSAPMWLANLDASSRLNLRSGLQDLSVNFYSSQRMIDRLIRQLDAINEQAAAGPGPSSVANAPGGK